MFLLQCKPLVNKEILDFQNGINMRVGQKVMSPVKFNYFNLHIFSRNFKGV